MNCKTHTDQSLIRMYTTSDIMICPKCFKERAELNRLTKTTPSYQSSYSHKIRAGYEGDTKQYYIQCSTGILLTDINKLIEAGYQISGNMGFLIKEREIFIDEKLRGE